MRVHLVDGTYELFRAHFAMPSIAAPDGREVGAVRGLVQTLISLLRQPEVTHVGVAFDTVIRSFRNDLFDGYKTGEDTPPELLGQFPQAERAAAALGLVVWPMADFEADDVLGTAAVRWRDAPGVDQIVLCSPDKDLAQVVQGDCVVTLDRRRDVITNEDGVRQKFGVAPASIPDYLGLVGDSADGIPGIPRWGAKGSAQVLDHYGHIEHIPPTQRIGPSASAAPNPWPPAWQTTWKPPCSTAGWPPCAWTSQLQRNWRTWNGKALAGNPTSSCAMSWGSGGCGMDLGGGTRVRGTRNSVIRESTGGLRGPGGSGLRPPQVQQGAAWSRRT